MAPDAVVQSLQKVLQLMSAPVRELVLEAQARYLRFRPLALDVLRSGAQSARPRLEDVDSQLARWMRDINALPYPDGPLGLNVGQNDYNRQGDLTYVDASGASQRVDLLSAGNLVFARSVPTIETGSAIRFDQASATARGVANTLNMPEYLHQYLAVDLTLWGRSDIIRIIERSLAISLPLRVLNATTNEAARGNPAVRKVVQISHSLANYPMNLSLLAFRPEQVADACMIQMAPLCGSAVDMYALMDAKNTSRGKISVVRPELDILEEFASARSAFVTDRIYQGDFADLRLPVNSHKFEALAKAYAAGMAKEGRTVSSMVDKYHAQRPPIVVPFVDSAQNSEKQITPRSWTQEEFLANPAKFSSDGPSETRSGGSDPSNPFSGLPEIPSIPSVAPRGPIRPAPLPEPAKSGGQEATGSHTEPAERRKADPKPEAGSVERLEQV
jgi:hypothetical protein